MSETNPQQPAASDWTNEVATIAGVTTKTVFAGPEESRLPGSDVTVYVHTVMIKLLPHAASDWQTAFELLEQMCVAAANDTSVGLIKYFCAVSRDTRKGVNFIEQIIFTDPKGVDRLKAMPEHDAFVAWLTAGGGDGRANWDVNDTPVLVKHLV